MGWWASWRGWRLISKSLMFGGEGWGVIAAIGAEGCRGLERT